MTVSRTLQRNLFLVLGAGLLSAGLSQAQSIYRIVGPDGKVTFSDRAPEKEVAGARTGARLPPADSPVTGELPYDLRQVAQRFPVTLYTGDNCAPCGTARSLLVQRGVPFAERTVNTNEDIDALQRLSGSNSLPYGTIGGQQLVGFSQTEWTQYLDAAGYPKQSRLPGNFRRSAAAPLVAIKPVEVKPSGAAAAESATTDRSAPRITSPAPTGPTPSNPAGIKF